METHSQHNRVLEERVRVSKNESQDRGGLNKERQTRNIEQIKPGIQKEELRIGVAEWAV